MNTFMLSLSRGFFLIIASLVFFTGPISAQTYSRLNLDANRIQWNYLLYEVKSTSADVITEVRLESPTSAEAQAALIEARQGDPVPVQLRAAEKSPSIPPSTQCFTAG